MAMVNRQPFVLLDDARKDTAADAQAFTDPREVFVAYRASEVADVLTSADAARVESGGTLAGYIAYEAGLALEPRLAEMADARSGSDGPLVWLALFDAAETIAADDVPAWLTERQGDSGKPRLGPLDPQLSPGGYAEAFETLQSAIRDGDIYQANLTFPLAGSYRGDEIALYAALRAAAKAGYGGLVFDGSHWLLSLSPELFVSLKEGELKAKPMKGTRPRSGDAAEDAALAADLAGSVKDKAENLMIVDLMRNDLARVAEPGSVRVDAPFAIESYPTVHQMVSTVRARIKDGVGTAELLRAIFPCGSITGAPKIRAMELIDQTESDPRGSYCGAIGRVDANGAAAFNVAIRTLRLTPIENAQGDAVLGVGSAIVADSQVMDEWREGVLKGGFARASSPDYRFTQVDLIETMRFTPEDGIELLELHLERLTSSASKLGFSFDRHTARNQIQALCFDLEDAAKIRLLLARSGALALETQPLPSAPDASIRCIALPLPVDPGDWRLRHKCSDRGFYEDAREVAHDAGADEALFLHPNGSLTEGSVHNVFVERDGMLLTPPISLGLLPGVLRRSLINAGRAKEHALTIDDLDGGFLLANAVRGLTAAELLGRSC